MRNSGANLGLRFSQLAILAGVFLGWHLLTAPGILPPLYFDDPNRAAFLFGEPLKVFGRIWNWFSGGDIYRHLWVTLVETLLAFLIGTVSGVAIGIWLALAPAASAILDPYIKALNAMPRVILAPIFFVWFGLGIASKVALGVTLVFFIVFFNVYQGVREVSPTVLANARMLGMREAQLFRHVYWPAALTWMFSSLHTSVGFALVGAVVGEYLGSAAGLGYKILEAETGFDVTGVFSGMLILMLVVIAVDTLVTMIENRLLVWRPEPQGVTAQG